MEKKTVIIYRASVNSNANKFYSFLVTISAMSTLWKQQESHFFGQFSSHTDEGLCILRNQTNGGMCFLCCWLCTRVGYTQRWTLKLSLSHFHSRGPVYILFSRLLTTCVGVRGRGEKIPLLFLFLEITHGDMFRLFAGAEAWCHSRFT